MKKIEIKKYKLLGRVFFIVFLGIFLIFIFEKEIDNNKKNIKGYSAISKR